ncbi:MAG: TIGR04295 family B12-binding domain-containing radical SAM protein [Alphaproteobacteria bacterium]
MRVALVNPPWTFDGSIYFGCREPHLPIELGAAQVLLEAACHEAQMFDGALDGMDMPAIVEAIAAYGPDLTVVTTAPTYLFWRCTQPEVTVPRRFLHLLGEGGGRTVAIGPHGSATPRAALRKLGCDVLVCGESEEAIVTLADGRPPLEIPGLAVRADGDVIVTGPPLKTRFTDLPALHWPNRWLRNHRHHHHRFDQEPTGPGAEIEASRGCPYACSFCAKLDFRDAYRRRDLAILAEEIDRLLQQDVTYLYFIDEIFLPWKELLELLERRKVEFGIQTRIDLWKPDMIELLGRAGCVSVEAGVESITESGRESLNKRCRMTTSQLTERLLHTKRHVPFVQANLIEVVTDDTEEVERWRDLMRDAGIWANDPVPLYPYPSSPDYGKLWGTPDDHAWERAHAHYLAQFSQLSDVQDERPLPLEMLECDEVA